MAATGRGAASSANARPRSVLSGSMEFDFDGGRGRSYTAALTLPIAKANA